MRACISAVVRPREASVCGTNRRPLVEAMRRDEHEFGDLYGERGPVDFARHQICPFHAAHVALEIAPGDIFVLFTRFEYWLQAHHTFPLYLALGAFGIKNQPMPPQELNPVFALVFDTHFIRKHEVFVLRTGIFGLVDRLDGNFDAVCRLCRHSRAR